ncbi:MAG: type II CAAX endopeptidase family protein [bacterium]
MTIRHPRRRQLSTYLAAIPPPDDGGAPQPPSPPGPVTPPPSVSESEPPRGLWETWSRGRILSWAVLLLAADFLTQLLIYQLGFGLFWSVALGSLLAILLPCYLAARSVGGNLASEFHLGHTSRAHLFWAMIVAVAGLLPTSILAGLSSRIHPVSDEWLKFNLDHLPQEPGEIVVAALAVTVIAPLAEELLFRGIVHRLVRRLWGAGPATIISGLVFGLLHYEPWYLFGLIGLGFLLSYIYEATRSLTPCFVTHGVYNGISFYLLLHDHEFATGGSGVDDFDIWLIGGSILLLVFACTQLARSD